MRVLCRFEKKFSRYLLRLLVINIIKNIIVIRQKL